MHLTLGEREEKNFQNTQNSYIRGHLPHFVKVNIQRFQKDTWKICVVILCSTFSGVQCATCIFLLFFFLCVVFYPNI